MPEAGEWSGGYSARVRNLTPSVFKDLYPVSEKTSTRQLGE